MRVLLITTNWARIATTTSFTATESSHTHTLAMTIAISQIEASFVEQVPSSSYSFSSILLKGKFCYITKSWVSVVHLLSWPGIDAVPRIIDGSKRQSTEGDFHNSRVLWAASRLPLYSPDFFQRNLQIQADLQADDAVDYYSTNPTKNFIVPLYAPQCVRNILEVLLSVRRNGWILTW